MSERLIDSQENMVCFSHFMEMPYVIGRAKNMRLPKRLLLLDGFLESDLCPENVEFPALRREMTNQVASYMARFANDENFEIGQRSAAGGNFDGITLHGIDFDSFLSIIGVSLRMTDASSIDEFWNEVANIANVKVVASKWTACHRYAPIHLRSSNSYWIEMVRNPYDRYGSVRLSHGHDLFDTAWESNDQFSFAANYSNPRYKVIKYEDLCTRTDEVLDDISSWLGERIQNLPLKNYFGSDFRPNTALNTLEGKSSRCQQSEHSSAVGSVFNTWGDSLEGSDKALINELCDFRGFYEKEEVDSHSKRKARQALRRRRMEVALRQWSARQALSRCAKKLFEPFSRAMGVPAKR